MIVVKTQKILLDSVKRARQRPALQLDKMALVIPRFRVRFLIRAMLKNVVDLRIM